MYPGTRAKSIARQVVPSSEWETRRGSVIRLIHRGILEAHLQSIHECAKIATNYGRRFPYACVASQCIAKRILESADLYPLSQLSAEQKEE